MACAGSLYAEDGVPLSWSIPTHNVDATLLTDLAGYRLYSGCEHSGRYERDVVELDDPGTTEIVLEGLPPGTCYFVVTAVDRAGEESAYSGEAVRVIPVAELPGKTTITVDWSNSTSVVRDAVSVARPTTGSRIQWSHTVGSGDNRAIVVQVAARNNGGRPPRVARVRYGDISFVEKEQRIGTTSELGASQWVLLDPPVGSDRIRVELDEAAASWLQATSVSYFNVDQLATIQTSGTLDDGAAAASAEIQAARPGAVLVSVLATTSNDQPSAGDELSPLEDTNVDRRGLNDWVSFAESRVTSPGSRSVDWSGLSRGSDNIQLVLALTPITGP